MKRGICICVVFVVVALASYRHKERQNDGFAIEKTASIIPNSSEWELPQNPDTIRPLLDQPFYYLGRGLQAYAFESADGLYVLKLMRHQRLQLHWIVARLPDFCTHREQVQCDKRVGYLFRSLKVAFLDVPEETGLLCVHLNKSPNSYGDVAIYDKQGACYMVSLDSTEFVLQKKALLVKPLITELMSQGKTDEAQKRIAQIFELLRACAKKGVCDTDGSLIRKNNLGFLPDRAIYIDTGKLTRKESMKNKERFIQDLKRLEPLHAWLQERYPELAGYFEERQKVTIAQF